jgi:hypothetical protein
MQGTTNNAETNNGAKAMKTIATAIVWIVTATWVVIIDGAFGFLDEEGRY